MFDLCGLVDGFFDYDDVVFVVDGFYQCFCFEVVGYYVIVVYVGCQYIVLYVGIGVDYWNVGFDCFLYWCCVGFEVDGYEDDGVIFLQDYCVELVVLGEGVVVVVEDGDLYVVILYCWMGFELIVLYLYEFVFEIVDGCVDVQGFVLGVDVGGYGYQQQVGEGFFDYELFLCELLWDFSFFCVRNLVGQC